MPTNEQARELAIKAGAVVKSFRQPGDDCAGWVSWWLRCRLKGNDFWEKPKHFTLLPMQPSSMRVLLSPPGQEDTKARAKAEKLEALYKRDGETKHSDSYINKGSKAGTSKTATSEAGPAIGTIVTGHKWISFTSISENNIGLAGEEDDPFEAAAAAMRSNAENAANIVNSFDSTAAGKYAAWYSLSTSARHAVGLDCLPQRKPRYFDPNLGEFEFQKIADLDEWWRNCFASRKGVPNSAFGMIGDSFKLIWLTRSF
jgi:hypothetical protein